MSHATDLVAANFCSTHLRAHTSHGLIALLLPSRLVVSFSGLWILALGLGAMPGRGGARPRPPNFGKLIAAANKARHAQNRARRLQ